MNTSTLRIAGAALAITLASFSSTASAWGYYRGHGYRGYSGWVVGGAVGVATGGTYLAFSTRPAYPYYYYPAPVYVSPPPVYVAPPVVYAAPPVQYVAPPPRQVASVDVIAYPAQNQSPSQQARDRGECERWAANQSGFDPAQASRWTTGAQTDSYTRAIGACLKGRGYSIN
ncbi:hypothetical protein [Bordetella genomosp. 13]|uniref:hypothetical protein n=1 Tax=Bordetella genomosp. 13 TaxID=463040 RepID=UPI000A3247A8|nr:hypothetical protein [Bordetella genomosp. 13]